MDAKCTDCLFFKTSVLGVVGQCRHLSPSALWVTDAENGDPVYNGVFPLVESDSWCGDYRNKETGAGLQ